MMPAECSNTNPRKKFDFILGEMTWLNEDYLEGNQAMLEGIESGLIGYETDNIIQKVSRRVVPPQAQPRVEGHQDKGYVPSPKSYHLQDSEQFKMENEQRLKHLDEILFGSPTAPVTRRSSSSTPPRAGQFPMPIHPAIAIGDERRKWKETTKSGPSQGLQQLPKSESASFPKEDGDDADHSLNATLASCSDFGGRSPQSESNDETSDQLLYEEDSCTCIFKSEDARTDSNNKFRLSPRMEKLDKLIPKTSKEFINTIRIVNTITSRPSEDDLQKKHDLVKSDINCSCGCREEKSSCNPSLPVTKEEKVREKRSRSSDQVSGLRSPRKNVNLGRSYKEVCIFGNHASSTETSAATSPTATHTHDVLEKVSPRCRTDNPQSSSSFPSLLKLHPDEGHFADSAHPKHSSPPLYSSILLRSHNPSSSNHDRKSTDNESTVASPPESIGSHDCGFCRTNKEPEQVYRSHPLRINDVVVCPALRKYVCCFCGATGDKAHTIKYCPKNPIGFFAKKGRHCPMPPSPVADKDKSVRKTMDKSDKKKNKSYDLESKSDSESVLRPEGAAGLYEPSKRLSENWTTAKTKGRRKKNGKRK